MKTITYDENEWKLVPVEPTDEMVGSVCYTAMPISTYKAMLAAAPQPPTAETVTAAEVFAAFDEVTAAHESNTWSGGYKDKSFEGSKRRAEAWSRVNDLRAKLAAAPQPPTVEPNEKPAGAGEGEA